MPCISALVTTSAAAATSSWAASSPNPAWASWVRRKRRTPARSSPRPKPIDAEVSGGVATAEKSRMKMRGSANAGLGTTRSPWSSSGWVCSTPGRRSSGSTDTSYGQSTETGNGWYTTLAAASIRR